ncbi:MAG: type II secretion system F family protein [Nanoarchaeota archaeon]|nr:type II secretion system F family protein [Nanoarchaeota archaeon]MBU4493280.1 type II secretion system F family protein [Nanoarchaeota archaeon]
MKIKELFKSSKKTKETKEKSQEKSIEERVTLYRKLQKQKKKKSVMEHRRNRLRYYLQRAGFVVESNKLSKIIFNLCVFLNLIISFYLIYRFSTDLKYGVLYVGLVMFLVWAFLFIMLLLMLWLLFYFIIDLRIFKRRIGIEDVLADFLQLTSANIRAGMPIDRALWYAVRPQFGVLASEIEMVAKETMSGEDLEGALRKFAEKYDSIMLKRSINLLVEGIAAGGEIGDLLNKIAIDIQESRIMKKELSANVTTYVIFITFATIVAAPLLFALSSHLLFIVSNLMLKLDVPSGITNFSINLSGAGMSIKDFRIFAITCLVITSYFSSVIIATIKKGEIKAGVKYIPIFMISTIVLFLIFSVVIGKLFGSII